MGVRSNERHAPTRGCLEERRRCQVNRAERSNRGPLNPFLRLTEHQRAYFHELPVRTIVEQEGSGSGLYFDITLG